MNPKLFIIGYVTIDVNILPDGEQTELTGGAAYFAALAGSNIYSKIGLVTRIGGDLNAEPLLNQIRPEGVRIISEGAATRSTQTYHSSTDLTDRSIDLTIGVSNDLNSEDIPAGWIENAEIIHIGTMPPDHQKTFIEEILARREHIAHTTKRPLISIDTDHYLLKNSESIKAVADNLRRADIVFLNRRESEILEDILEEIPLVILKRDRDGASLAHHGVVGVHVPAPHVDPLDVTGAGDVLAGAFCAGLATGLSEEAALNRAVELASTFVGTIGEKSLLRETRRKHDSP